MEAWANVKTAVPSRRELNLTLQMCPKGRAESDGNLEHVGKELPKPSRKSHGDLKDALEDHREAGGPSGARCPPEGSGPGKLDI